MNWSKWRRTVPDVYQHSFDSQTDREESERGPWHERHSNWICSEWKSHVLRPYVILTYLLTYSMEQSPWEAVLHLVKKFPAFYGTRSFLTALTRDRHLSLSWASPIQSSHPHPTSWRYILLLSSNPSRNMRWNSNFDQTSSNFTLRQRGTYHT
jgi:hypothetical protein